MIPDGGVTFELWGIPALVILYALIELVKKIRPELKDRGVIYVTLGLAWVLSIIFELFRIGYGEASEPVLIEILMTFGRGLVAALAAGGFFSLTKRRPEPDEGE